MSSEWRAGKQLHVFICPKLTLPSLLSNLVPVISLVQLQWHTGSCSHAQSWTRSMVLVHQFLPLFSPSQASEQDPCELLSQEKAFPVEAADFYQLHNRQVQVACVMACTAL